MAIGYWIGGTLLSGLGLAGLVESVFDIRRLLAARHWPVAEGRVVHSRVHGHGQYHDDYTERLKLKYEFTVEGRTYTGQRVRAGQELDLTLGHCPGKAWSTARSDADRFPPGTEVSVLYDPANPKRCCLQEGGWGGIVLKVALCVGLLVGGGLMITR